MSGELLTAGDTARALGISQSRLWRLARSRDLGRRLGRSWVYTPADVEVLRERRPGWPKGRPRPPRIPPAPA
ncbi:MAG: helix-turn-helix domain-containing protein [SAR202 cluster bacterium]|nr:helix-turn-helix domain-containing protein [SAR202 cluster bacterium]